MVKGEDLPHPFLFDSYFAFSIIKDKIIYRIFLTNKKISITDNVNVTEAPYFYMILDIEVGDTCNSEIKRSFS
jgi:hypothetical protein